LNQRRATRGYHPANPDFVKPIFREKTILKFLPATKAVTRFVTVALTFTTIYAPSRLGAHGFEGDRFFPPTIQTDDPFATDELSLPTISVFSNPAGDGSPRTREIDISAEFTKEIFPKFAWGISETYVLLSPKGSSTLSGFDNLALSAKYQLLEIPGHEFIFSAGVEWEIGGTGRKSIGADNYSTVSPALYFGKGFGDLPDSLALLKPIAITGVIAQDIPVRSLDSNVLEWGLAFEYSLPYLEQHVKEIGLPHPFRDMIPLVELSMESPENRNGGKTTGTINPGILWESRYFQLGAEATIPINHASGANVGFVFNVQIYIDDLFPKFFGHPLIGGGDRAAVSTSLTK
jgi:hypothetical protein